MNLNSILLTRYKYSKLIVKAQKCTSSHNTVVCVCECVCVVAEQRDSFCQSGQCWKRFKVGSTVDILLRLLPCFSALTLLNMFSWVEESVHMCI